jgi:hypothetical protein
MRTRMVAAMLGIMLPCIGVAENAAQGVKFEFGTTLNAVLSDTLDSRRNKVGDPVRAKTSEDVKAGGVVVIPRGARLLGHVTEAQPAPQKDAQARLGVEFDRAELKDGQQVLLHTAFYALAAPQGAGTERNSSPAGGFGGFSGGATSITDRVSTSSRGSADDSDGAGFERHKEEDLKPSPGAIGGLNGTGTLYASSRGVFGLDDISLEPNTMASSGSSVILANARNVHLSSGTRMLLSVEAPGKPQ